MTCLVLSVPIRRGARQFTGKSRHRPRPEKEQDTCGKRSNQRPHSSGSIHPHPVQVGDRLPPGERRKRPGLRPSILPGGLHSPFFEQRQKADCRILDLRVSENFPMLMQVPAQKVDDMVHWHRVPVPTHSGIRH